MGCNCRKRRKAEKLLTERKPKAKKRAQKPVTDMRRVKFLHCPTCKVTKSMRLADSELVNRRCSECDTRIIHFDRPPSPRRLKRALERRSPKG